MAEIQPIYSLARAYFISRSGFERLALYEIWPAKKKCPQRLKPESGECEVEERYRNLFFLRESVSTNVKNMSFDASVQRKFVINKFKEF